MSGYDTRDPLYPQYGSGLQEVDHNEFADNTVGIVPTSQVKDSEVAWDIGGAPGMTNMLPYTEGVVEVNRMEDWRYTGRTVRLRRPPEGASGPVAGGVDYSSQYPAILTQQADNSVPDAYMWASLAGGL